MAICFREFFKLGNVEQLCGKVGKVLTDNNLFDIFGGYTFKSVTRLNACAASQKIPATIDIDTGSP